MTDVAEPEELAGVVEENVPLAEPEELAGVVEENVAVVEPEELKKGVEENVAVAESKELVGVVEENVTEPEELKEGAEENVVTDDENVLPSSENMNNVNRETEMEINDDKYAEHVTYQEDGTAIYTDPDTKYQYKWDKEKNEWVGVPAQVAETTENPYENEHYRWCHETNKWIPKENVKETEFYKWDDETSKWVPKFPQGEGSEKEKEGEKGDDGKVYYYEGDVHLYRDKDGAIFFWDTEKKAWFPRIDDDFMAMYQMNYGFIDNTTPEPSKTQEPCPEPKVEPVEDTPLDDDEQQKPKKRTAPAEPPKWFEVEQEKNTKVYVSNLPNDLTEEEFIGIMSKCGMIMKDIHSHKFKVKLYRDHSGELKGDGLCHYIKVSYLTRKAFIFLNIDKF